MVSVLAFYSDDPSSNPAEVYNFSVKLLLKRTKINKKEAGVGPFFKYYFSRSIFNNLKLFTDFYISGKCQIVAGSINGIFHLANIVLTIANSTLMITTILLPAFKSFPTQNLPKGSFRLVAGCFSGQRRHRK